ncbi:MAG: hypothetical protein ACLT9S_02110 [Faecalibacterium sp.]
MASASPHTTLNGPQTRLERLIQTPGGQAAEQRLHHVAQKRPDDEQPEQVGNAEEVCFRSALAVGCRAGGGRVGLLDRAFHASG